MSGNLILEFEKFKELAKEWLRIVRELGMEADMVDAIEQLRLLTNIVKAHQDYINFKVKMIEKSREVK